MHLRNRRRGVLVGFAAGAAVLAMAGSAFACTETRGTVTITGPNGVTVTNRGTGQDDLAPGNGYCEKPSRVHFIRNALTMEFSLAVELVTDCPTAINYLPADPGLHEVRWIKAEDAVTHGPATNCYTAIPSSNPWQVVGLMNVAENPSGADGSGTYSLPATMLGPGNICVAPLANTQFAPPTIFMKWTLV